MIGQIINTPEIKWIMSKAQVEVPYEDEDYTEHGFSGSIPNHMASKIKTTVKKVMGKGKDTISEVEGGIEKVITIKFGKTKRTQNDVMFFYTEERI